MKSQLKEKIFDFRTVQGISLNQLTQHYQLYKGYVQKINQIWAALAQNQFSDPNPTYSPYRALKSAETYALDAVKLHELYFENIIGTKKTPSGSVISKIIKDFGTYDNWKRDLWNAGKSARGWVVTAYDPIDNKIRNYLSDAHDQGAIWHAYPLLVLDVYEHAYMIDFGIDRDKYLNRFFENINWEVVEKRYNNIFPQNTNHSEPPSPSQHPIYGNRGWMMDW